MYHGRRRIAPSKQRFLPFQYTPEQKDRTMAIQSLSHISVLPKLRSTAPDLAKLP